MWKFLTRFLNRVIEDLFKNLAKIFVIFTHFGLISRFFERLVGFNEFESMSHKNLEICPKCVKISKFLARFLKRVIKDLKFKKKLKLDFLVKT